MRPLLDGRKPPEGEPSGFQDHGHAGGFSETEDTPETPDLQCRLTPHGKILLALADEAVALHSFYISKVVAEVDREDEGWIQLYLQQKHLDAVSDRLATIARISRALADETLVKGGAS